MTTSTLRAVIPTHLPPGLSRMRLGLTVVRDAIDALGPGCSATVVHVGHEALAPGGDAEAVIFSLSNPLEYRLVFDYCHAAGLPVAASRRTERMPLLIGGGMGFANPEPLASFFDVIVLGLDTAPLVAVLQTVRRHPGLRRRELVDELSAISNVYLPSKIHFEYASGGEISAIHPEYDLVRTSNRDQVRPLSAMISSHEAVLMPDVGCKSRCSFCALTFFYGYQSADVRELTSEVDKLAAQGVETVKLNSATAFQFAEVVDLLDHIRDRGMRVAVGSVRIDQADPGLVRRLAGVQTLSDTQYLYRQRPTNGGASLTFGIEAASNRLLRLLQKGLERAQIEDRLVELATTAGLDNVGFYFLSGIPTETDDDRRAVAELVSLAVDTLDPVSGEVFVNVNALIPTPHTPMQRVGLLSPELHKTWLTGVADQTRSTVGRQRFAARVRLGGMSADDLLLETTTMRSDRRTGRFLALLYGNGSAAPVDEAGVSELLEKASLPGLDFYRRRIPEAEILPWQLVQSPKLAAEERAFHGREQEAIEAIPSTR